jgi:hypothetical protein
VCVDGFCLNFSYEQHNGTPSFRKGMPYLEIKSVRPSARDLVSATK